MAGTSPAMTGERLRLTKICSGACNVIVLDRVTKAFVSRDGDEVTALADV
jgi:hypothetical protein